MTAIRDDLRGRIVKERRHPIRWGNPKGLTQKELARKTQTSQVWIRQIETGYRDSASPNTLGVICYALGIPADWLRRRGYNDVANIVAEWSKSDILSPDGTPEQEIGIAETYLRQTPGLTDDEKSLLVDALKEIRRTEPLGRDLWRRKHA